MHETDAESCSRVLTSGSEPEQAMLEYSEVDAVIHEPGEESSYHTHTGDHVIFMSSGKIRWTVDEEVHEATAGDTIVTPAGVPHKFEVMGDDPSMVVCMTAPVPDSRDVSDAEPVPESE